MRQSMIPWRVTATAALALLVLTLALATPGSAQQTSFGDWRVGTTPTPPHDSLYAATINDSSNILGQYCYPAKGSCLWLLTLPMRCTNGAIRDHRDTHPIGLGIPIRCNQRTCEARPARTEGCSLYLTPNSRQVSSTTFDMAG
jgi:hypothetical protein